MARKSPTTGAKPNRDDGQSYVAEDLWFWIKEHRNSLLLVLTIFVAATVLFIMRSRATSAKQKRAHQAFGEVVTGFDQSEGNSEERIKRIQAKLSKYSEFEHLTPWFRLHLADAHYMAQQYNQAVQTLKELRSKHPDTVAADQAKLFLERIRQEQSYVNNELEQRRKAIQQNFNHKKLVFDITEEDLPSTKRTSGDAKQKRD